MKCGRKLFIYILYIVLGTTLFSLGCMEIVDSFWSGMGSALIVISVVRLIQFYRFRKDEAYREKVEIETSDERNRFLRNKAWAWSGYLFILITSVFVIVLRVAGQELLSLAASYAVCLMLILYWVCYLVLRKKY